MSILGPNMPNEVGLRLLLCPLGSNVVHKPHAVPWELLYLFTLLLKQLSHAVALSNNSALYTGQHMGLLALQRRLLTKLYHGIIFNPICLTESHDGTHLMVVFQGSALPSHEVCFSSLASTFHYRSIHEAFTSFPFELVAIVYRESGKFISAHEGEFQFAKAIAMKIMILAKHFIDDGSQPVPPVPPPEGSSMANQSAQVETLDSNNNDDEDNDGYVTVAAT